MLSGKHILLIISGGIAAYKSLDLIRRLRERGCRVEVVEAEEPLGKRIRNAKMQKLPYVLVVGDDDVLAGTVGVNPRGGDVERDVSLEDFTARLVDEIAAHR